MEEDPLLIQESLSQLPAIADWIFSIFLILFILFGSISRKISFQSIVEETFTMRKKDNSFYSLTTNEWYGKLLLCLQTCVILSVFLCKVFTDKLNLELNTPTEALTFIGISTLILCACLLIKWLAYYLVGIVFFDKFAVKIWINNFFSLVAFTGIVLFIPILLYFYVNEIENICFILIVIYFLLFVAFTMYKSFVLFFSKPSRLLNLFLYLCAQELIPLFILWKTLVLLMFNFEGK